MSAPDRINCRVDFHLTDDGDFLGTCWRDSDQLTTEYVRADIAADLLAALELAHEWMGHVEGYYMGNEYDKDIAALTASIARAKGGAA